MTDAIIKRAWRGKAPPQGCEQIPFLCLRAVYHEYRRGALERDTAEHLKAWCMVFTELTHKKQRALMIYALGSEFECEGRLEDIKPLVWAIIEGKPPALESFSGNLPKTALIPRNKIFSECREFFRRT